MYQYLNMSATCSQLLPVFQGGTTRSLSCLVHSWLWQKGVPREMTLLVLGYVEKGSMHSWWAQLPVPTIALQDALYFKLWFCFLEWDAERYPTVSATLKSRGSGIQPFAYNRIYSARQFLSWAEKAQTCDHSAKVIMAKTFKCEYDMEVEMAREMTWQPPFGSAWLDMGVFMSLQHT